MYITIVINTKIINEFVKLISFSNIWKTLILYWKCLKSLNYTAKWHYSKIILQIIWKCRNFRIILQKESNSILLRLAERSTQHGARKQRLKLTETCFCQIVKLIYIIGVFGFNDLWRNISFILQSRASSFMSFFYITKRW